MSDIGCQRSFQTTHPVRRDWREPPLSLASGSLSANAVPRAPRCEAGLVQAHAQAIEAVVAEVRLRLPNGPFDPGRGWGHMGAVIADACMQGGLTYATGVLPRVQRLVDEWPDAATVTGFQVRSADRDALAAMLIRNTRKLAAVADLTELLAAEGVDTCDEMTAWLVLPDSRRRLLAVKGISPKTADYLHRLVGLPEVAVDRHLQRFVRRAWPSASSYTAVHDLISAAADALREDVGGLEHAIWLYESGQAKGDTTP